MGHRANAFRVAARPSLHLSLLRAAHTREPFLHTIGKKATLFEDLPSLARSGAVAVAHRIAVPVVVLLLTARAVVRQDDAESAVLES
jgi:hypothetical protein